MKNHKKIATIFVHSQTHVVWHIKETEREILDGYHIM